MSTTKDLQNIHQEGRLKLAIKALKIKQSSIIQAAAWLYNIPWLTLSCYLCDSIIQCESQIMNCKLTSTEETTLIQWILLMNQYNLSFQAPHIQQMAQILLNKHINSAFNTVWLIDEYWVCNFINCHDKLESKYHCKYNYQQAQCENSKIIQNRFHFVQNTIAKYEITYEDIYNFDKTDFQMRIIRTVKVVTESERVDCPVMTQLRNQE